MMRFQSEYHTGPVTAVCCHGDLLLAGIGSQVHVYCLKTLQLKQSVSILPAGVVHGFRQDPGSDRVCVFGQKSIRLIQYDLDRSQLTQNHLGNHGNINQLEATQTHLGNHGNMVCVSEVYEFPDWIWDVVWLQGQNQLCLALGHNVVITFDIERECITNTVHCADKCILYCAKFLTSSPDCLILAAGTVFNQVVMWSVHSDRQTDGRIKPFHRLTGHQGVIFNVDYRADLGLICSVSDDRSIRLYKVKFTDTMTAPRINNWEIMDSSLLHVLYGHSARVWDAKLLGNCIVSVAEDSSCCVWSYEGNVIKQFKGHKGKSIWSMCVDKGEKHVFTGGGDNSVRMWNLQSARESNQEANTKSLDLQLDDGDFPRNTMLLDSNNVLVITNLGNLLLFNESSVGRTVVMSDALFSSYTVMDVYTPSLSVAIGNIHGTLRVLKVTGSEDCGVVSRKDVQVCDGKIRSVLWLDDSNILTTAPDGLINIWRVDADCIIKVMTLDLPDSKQRFVTTATLVTETGRELLVCGDRMGSVFLYRLDYANKESALIQTFGRIHGKAGVTYISYHSNQVYSAGKDGMYRVYNWTDDGQLALLNTNRVCKGLEWVERLEILEEEEDVLVQGFHTNLFVVWSVRQNQKLLEVSCGGGHRSWDYCCHDNRSTFVYVKAREVKVTNIVNRPNQRILKTALHGRELCDAKLISSGIDANGCQVYALATCSEDTAVCLSLLYYENGIANFRVCHTLTGHISSVRCMELCHSSLLSQHSTANRKLIFTGGGRAQLKVWRVDVKMNQSECRVDTGVADNAGVDKSVREDESVKAVKKCDDMSESMLTVSDEAKSKSCDNICDSINASDYKTKQNILSTEKHLTSNIASGNCKFIYECIAGLQLSELGKRVKKPWRYPVENSDPETRILDLTVVTLERSRSLYIIGAACSDGIVRLFSFDEASRHISVLASSPFHDHCVLRVCHVIIPDQSEKRETSPSNNTRIVLLSSATDGKVAFWDITAFYNNLLRTKHNDDPLKSSLEESTGDENGSDDDHLAVCENDGIGPQPDVKLELKPCFSIDLHQSGINSLHFGKCGNQYILVTGGDDNALKVTLVTMDTSSSEVKVIVTNSGGHLSAHSTQITGAWYVEVDCVLTASIDQRLCLWKIQHNTSPIQLTLIETCFTSVSDVANIDVWTQGKDKYVLISGNGLELVKLVMGTEVGPHLATDYLANIVT